MRAIQSIRLLGLAATAATIVACGPSEPDRAANAEPATDYADTVLINGGIYTVNENRDWAEAAAIRDGVFTLVGANVDVEQQIGPKTKIIDLAGNMALPGFHDAHVHPIMGGEALLGCDLSAKATVEAILATVTNCHREQPDGWLEGHAFDLALFGPDGPDKQLLDAISADRPIILWGSDGHNAWANSKALELASIDADTQDPDLGVIERRPDGSPSGTLRETAQELVREVIPPITSEERNDALAAGVNHLNSFGITSWIDAWVGEEDYQAYQDLEQRGGLSGRVVTSLTFESGFAKHSGDDFDRVLDQRSRYESDRIRNSSIKLFLDGVLEGETAALLEPYVGMHGHSGELILEPEALNAAVTRFDALGLQVHMHAIGDRAVRAGLDAIEAAQTANGNSDNRHHISHLQMIHVDDIERFGQLDTAANFQALWALPDEWIMELNLPVVGEERVQGMYPIGSVQKAGGRIVGGSDWNVSSANPLEAIEVAIRRQDPTADNGPVLNAGERVSLETMIDAYTINSAWLMHHEEQTGSIKVGKKADLVILDRSLFDIPVSEISDVEVLQTLVEGEVVYLAD